MSEMRLLRYNGRAIREIIGLGYSGTLRPGEEVLITEEAARGLLNMNHTANLRGEFGPSDSSYGEMFTDITPAPGEPLKVPDESTEGTRGARAVSGHRQ